MTSFSISRASERASQKRPGEKRSCSTSVQWHSLLVQTYDQPGVVDAYETLASPDFLIVLVERGEYNFESFSSGTWKRATYQPGVAGITAPLTANRLRWHSATEAESRVIRAYIPAAFFEEAAEEFRRAGIRSRALCQDALAIHDSTVASVLLSLSAAARAGMPNIYAESAARYLATHLMSRALGLGSAETDRTGCELTDRRLRRTLEFMACNFAEPLSVERLAQEAGISPFHFSRLFKLKVGITPHQHLLRLRVRRAEELLKKTDLAVASIAAACGYAHAGHFAAAFFKVTSKRPAEYRRGD